jgi:four helix bundle protein
MRPHENLAVWNRALDFVVVVYRATEALPREEKFGLTSQIRRAAVSIPANIAEGAARVGDKEFLHFLSTAQGSASELETELLIANRLGYVGDSKYAEMRTELDNIGRMIVGLSKSLKQRQGASSK